MSVAARSFNKRFDAAVGKIGATPHAKRAYGAWLKVQDCCTYPRSPNWRDIKAALDQAVKNAETEAHGTPEHCSLQDALAELGDKLRTAGLAVDRTKRPPRLRLI
jgi:hypothetical protein